MVLIYPWIQIKWYSKYVQVNQILPNVDQIKGNSLFSAGKYGIANQGRLNVLSVSYNTTQGHYCDYNYFFLCNCNQRGTAAHTSVFCSGNEGRLFKEISNYRFKAQFKIMIVCNLYYKMYTGKKKEKKSKIRIKGVWIMSPNKALTLLINQTFVYTFFIWINGPLFSEQAILGSG